MKKETGNINKWKDILYSRSGRILLKVPTLPIQIQCANLYQIPCNSIFHKKSLNWYGTARILNNQSKLEKKQVEHRASLFQIIFKAIVSRAPWYWHKKRYINSLNRREAEINPNYMIN